MESKIKWSIIKLDDWKNGQDMVISRRLKKYRPDGTVLRKRGEVEHPSRERVRQKRMEIYLEALQEALLLPELEGEQDIRASLAWALKQKGSELTKSLNEMRKMELALDSPLRGALAEANRIFHPNGWHGREGATKNQIRILPTSKMAKMTVKEIAHRVGCGVSYVSQALKDLGMTCLAGHRGKELYNWKRFFPYSKEGRPIKFYNKKTKSYNPAGKGRWQQVKDLQIAEALGVPNPLVVTQYRNRNGFRRRPIKQSVDLTIKTS